MKKAIKWISVKDRLPHNWESVLTCYSSSQGFGIITIRHKIPKSKSGGWGDGRRRCPNKNVTHWMPLPEPPESEE